MLNDSKGFDLLMIFNSDVFEEQWKDTCMIIQRLCIFGSQYHTTVNSVSPSNTGPYQMMPMYKN